MSTQATREWRDEEETNQAQQELRAISIVETTLT